MTDWIDRMLADGLTRAGGLFEEERGLGKLLWSKGGWRCYSRDTANGLTLTLRNGGDAVIYEIGGVSLGDLK